MTHGKHRETQFMSRDSHARHPDAAMKEMHGSMNPGFSYAERTSARAKATPGRSFEPKGKRPPLGEGGRFEALAGAIGKRKGVRSPGAVAAAIGRKKYGKAAFQKMASAGHKM
jgi:hypothetical protein